MHRLGYFQNARPTLERSASFRSIHRTLNYILLGDRIWMGRFTEGDSSENGITGTPALDTILYDDLSDLRAAREDEDERIEVFMKALPEAFLTRQFRYINNAGTCAPIRRRWRWHTFSITRHTTVAKST